MPDLVICLLSALAYHNLSDVNPLKVYFSLPNKGKQSKLIYPPIKVFLFRKNLYELVVIKVETPTGNFKIYDVEETFKHRKTKLSNIDLTFPECIDKISEFIEPLFLSCNNRFWNPDTRKWM